MIKLDKRKEEVLQSKEREFLLEIQKKKDKQGRIK